MRHGDTRQGLSKRDIRDARALALIDRYFPSWYPTDRIEARLDDAKVLLCV